MKKSVSVMAALIFAVCYMPLHAEAAVKPTVEVVFVLDTTGSMGGLISAAKDKIWAIASTLATAKPVPDISMGLVGYRDRGDTYITKHSELTLDIDSVYSDLMDFQANGGGDGPESVNQALYEAVYNFPWDNDTNTYKVIFLVGDWPPHMDYQDDVKYPVSAKTAKEKGIIINTIQMGDLRETEPVWREIARITGGEYFRIGSVDISTHYETPYDGEIAELSVKYDDTRVYYGDAEVLKEVAEKERTESKIYRSADKSAIAQRLKYNLSESGKKNFTGSQELVDQIINGNVKLEDVKEEELPQELKKMTSGEREQHINEKIKTRKEIEKKLRGLNEKRQEYIKRLVRENAEKEENSFDNKVFRSMQKQGAEKNINMNEGMVY